MQVQGFAAGKFNILNTHFEYNTASAHSTVCVYSVTDGVMDNCVFKDNVVAGSTFDDYARGGAGLYLRESSGFILTNTNFTHNVVTGNFDGGAVYAFEATFGEITNCQFERNVAPNDGGAFYSTIAQTDLTFKDCTFTSNTATDGGAVYLHEGSDNVTFDNCEFDCNNASNKGGAIWFDAINSNIVNSAFNNNHANIAAAIMIPSKKKTALVQPGLYIIIR